MHKKKSTLCVYITLLQLGIFNSIAVAQIVEPATNLSFQLEEATTVPSPEALHSPQTVAEVDPIPHTLKEANWLSQTTKPATVSTDSSEAHAPSLIPETSSPSLQVTELKQEQTSPTAEPSSPPEPAQPEPDSPPPEQFIFTPRAGLRYTGEGAGFEGFTSVEGFFPLAQTPGRNLTYSDLRLHIFNNGSLGGNATLGHRIYLPASGLTVGGYISYDNRDTGNTFFNQIGVGLEALSESWDVRLNGYLPVGDNRSLVNTAVAGTSRFSQNVLLLDFNKQFEAAMTGFDLEAGGVLPIAQAGYLRPFAGTYYYNAEGSEGAWGIRGGLSYYGDYLQASVAVQDDRIFDTQVVFKVGINFPGSVPRSRVKPPSALARMGESVVRQAAIAVEDQKILSQETALNPATGQPWFFQHVALGNSGGNGTFESPFDTVENGLNATRSDGNDIVYVQPGTNPGIPNFTIRDRVQVLSTGPVQPLDTEQLGNIQLPLSGAGVLPEVTGSVTLGNDTTISGFAINSPPGAGIQGTNLSNVTIRDNRITNTAQEGINLSNVTGNVSITNNVISNTTGMNPFNPQFGIGGGTSGIRLSNNAGAANLMITRNAISNTTDSGIAIISDGTAQVTAMVADNTVTDSVGSGIFFAVLNGQVTAMVSNNTATGNRGRIPQESGIRFGVFNNAQGIPIITNNRTTNNQGNGIFVGSEGDSQVTATIENNRSINNLGNGIFLGANENSRMTGLISGNTVMDNQVNNAIAPFPSGAGIFVGAQVNGQTTATIANNTAIGNGDIGIFFFVANNGRGTGTITNNTSRDNQRNGIEVNVGLNGPPGNPAPPDFSPTAMVTVADNIVTGNLGIGQPLGGGGIFILGFNNSVVQVALERNRITNNAIGDGAFAGTGLVAVQNAQIFTGVRFNTLTGNSGANPGLTALTGVPIADLAGPAKICLQLNNNTSDTGFALVRPAGTTLQADTAGNTGPIIVPVVPVEPLGDCVVP